MISIIVPVYNVEKYLNKCIDSILNQTYKDYELLLIDDGSTDSSGPICDSYAQNDSRIQVFHCKNQGVSAARNFGIDHSKGDYICFVDSDDYIQPNFIETLLTLLTDNNADIAMCNYLNVDSNGLENKIPPKTFSNKTMFFTPSDIAKEVYKKGGILFTVIWNKLYAKKIWRSLRFTVGIHCEDEEIVQKLYHLSDKTVYIDNPLYNYVNNPTGIMHSAENLIINLTGRMYAFYNDTFFLLKNGETDTAKEAFHCWFADGMQVLSLLKKKVKFIDKGEPITYSSFLRKFRARYREAKKEIKFSFKRRIYYDLATLFPTTIITLRDLKHKIEK